MTSVRAAVYRRIMTPRCGRQLRTGNTCSLSIEHKGHCFYRNEDDFKAYQKAYRATPQRGEVLKKYRTSPKGAATQARFAATPKGAAHKAYVNGYGKTPTGRARCRAAGSKYTATKVAATIEPFTSADLAAHIAALGGRCVYCPGPYEHLDHVYPLARGGAHALSNLVPACAPCNQRKHDSLPLRWLLA